MRSIRFSKQKSFHSFKTKGVSNFKTAFNLALYNLIVYWMSRQDNATFVEQVTQHRSCQLLLFTYFFFEKCPEKHHRFCMYCMPFMNKCVGKRVTKQTAH